MKEKSGQALSARPQREASLAGAGWPPKEEQLRACRGCASPYFFGSAHIKAKKGRREEESDVSKV